METGSTIVAANMEDDLANELNDTLEQRNLTGSMNNYPTLQELKLPFFSECAQEEPQELLCLSKEDVIPMEIGWGYCLAGICLGRFPGVKAVEELANSWPSKPRVACHSNGLIFFRFRDRRSMLNAHAKGPYSIYQRLITLHLLTQDFSFEEQIRKDVQIWMNVSNIPMEFWNTNALGKIASRMGNPIMVDTTTYLKKKLDFARILVAVNPTKEPPLQLEILSPEGYITKLDFHYDFIPKLCLECNRNTTKYKELHPKFRMRQKLSIALSSAKCKGIYMPFKYSNINKYTVEEGEKWLNTPFIKRLLELNVTSKLISDDLKTLLKAKGIDEGKQNTWVEVCKYKVQHSNDFTEGTSTHENPAPKISDVVYLSASTNI
ncbi:hypothetical protein C2S52_023296 [Perilla frutescens var. hirtella]|nr:hypothetical protein C2S52_023296 [Perilla frutescens var. hirtella]